MPIWVGAGIALSAVVSPMRFRNSVNMTVCNSDGPEAGFKFGSECRGMVF